MNKIRELFKKSKFKSSKYDKYFKNYDDLLSKFAGKNIKMIEVGIQDGGSLKIWQEYFGKNSEIIGVDLNPECKKFEENNIKIFIGSQSDKFFWKGLFNKIGNVDLIIDDGGHMNDQQIITAVSCIPYINDGGMLITEDVHASYLKRFNNPSKYSFINFVKKSIDDINSLFPNLKKFSYSINQFVFSIQNFESMTVFFIDRKRCKMIKQEINEGEKFYHKDYREHDYETNIFKNFKLFSTIKKKFSYMKIKKFFR